MTAEAPRNDIRIVLVETSHPGNIGATARAMKCMGLEQLYLVRPPRGFPGADVTARAAGADDILMNAVVCDELDEAIHDCVLVAGTTARDRSIPWPVLSPEQCAHQAVTDAASGPVALLFGRERSGLKNEEIDRCHCVVHIPTNPAFSSLNIAAAVQIMAYELFLATMQPSQDSTEPRIPLATAGQLEQLYDHLERCMMRVGFFDPDKPRRLQRRLRRLFNRAQLDQNELNILRGFLAAVEDNLPQK